MYLNQLNSEQKEIFIDLCIHAALANHEFADKEKDLIQQYCTEMQLSKVRYEVRLDLEETLARLLEISSQQELKIVALELTALIVSDYQFDELEKQFMNNFIAKIQLKPEELKEILLLLDELSAIYNKINSFIFG